MHMLYLQKGQAVCPLQSSASQFLAQIFDSCRDRSDQGSKFWYARREQFEQVMAWLG